MVAPAPRATDEGTGRPPAFLPSTRFRDELEQRVAAYLKGVRGQGRDDPRMYRKTVVMFLWLAASYGVLLFGVRTWWQAGLCAVSLGLAMAGIGFCVQHDGGHGSYSRRRWVNRMMALSLNLLGGTAQFWHYKHNIAHHSYPNVSGSDDDINLYPVARLSPHDPPRRPWHRLQHLYIWGLYAMLAIEWQLIGDVRILFKLRYGDTHIPAVRGGQLAVFWVTRVLFLALAFGIPLLLHPPMPVIAVYLVAGVVLGLTLALVFQLAHCVQEAAYRAAPGADRRIQNEWAVHQVEASVDFARSSRFLTWYLGGLNFQIEHHLFPKVSHVHYPALSPIVEEVCQKHGVRHYSYPSFGAALRGHVSWLKQLGSTSSSPG